MENTVRLLLLKSKIVNFDHSMRINNVYITHQKSLLKNLLCFNDLLKFYKFKKEKNADVY